MKEPKMSYAIGFISKRTGVPSEAQQKEKLIEHGVAETSIYTVLDDAMASIRTGDTLVVYTVAILGRNRLNDTFVSLYEKLAKGCYSLSEKRFYPTKQNSMQDLALAWKELDGVTKRQMAAVGREKGGRSKSGVWHNKDIITADYNNGIVITELAEIYKTSEATIRRILK